eukprot:scaffold417554_cov24-Prasinocladus_malaysianus.AAC.1
MSPAAQSRWLTGHHDHLKDNIFINHGNSDRPIIGKRNDSSMLAKLIDMPTRDVIRYVSD